MSDPHTIDVDADGAHVVFKLNGKPIAEAAVMFEQSKTDPLRQELVFEAGPLTQTPSESIEDRGVDGGEAWLLAEGEHDDDPNSLLRWAEIIERSNAQS